MRRPKAALAGLASALALSLAFAGCGDDDKSNDRVGQPPATTAPAPDARTEAIAGDRFDPQAIYRRAADGVVTVLSIFKGRRNRLFGGDDPLGGQGSGFVLNERGEVVTNAHVVTSGEGASLETAREVYVEFADRNRVRAKIVGYDPNADVALLRVAPDGFDLVPLELASGEGLQVGQPVAAIGSPFGEKQSLSVGVISATGRSVRSLTDFEIHDALQTDAAINHGNSGGPLLDAAGRVIGINQQIESSSGGGEGVGFAVPVTAVRRSIEELRRNGRVDYAYIGISAQALYPQLSLKLGIPSRTGALIAEVVKGGPAARAGLRGGGREIRFQGGRVKRGGDTIVAIEGERLVNENDLSRLIAKHEPGETITVEVLRGEDRRKVRVKLGRRPARLPGRR